MPRRRGAVPVSAHEHRVAMMDLAAWDRSSRRIRGLCGAASESGTRLFMYLGVIEAAIMSMVFWVGSGFGITGVALGWLLVHPLMRLPVYVWIFRRTGMTLLEYLSALWPSLRATTLMAAAVVAAKLLLVSVYLGISFLQRRRLWGMYEDFRAVGRTTVFRADAGSSQPASPIVHPSSATATAQALDRRGLRGIC
jgi:hypothetical protein